jgi:hypothetical protein
LDDYALEVPLEIIAAAPLRLGERPELEEAALELERRARGWLESDEARDSATSPRRDKLCCW